MALAIGERDAEFCRRGDGLAKTPGETAALRMHAAELLMMLGTVIVMISSGPRRRKPMRRPLG